MTERWRKKLGDLDKQGPTDDVFERAKDGSMHLDLPSPGMKTSTRIATAVAAFAVFALAISVFAIPALRMQDTQAGGATTGLFPLWPSQTPDQLKQLQADADAGNAAWALDPKLVAERFANDVMGWSDATVSQEFSSSCGVAYGGYSPGQPSSPGYGPGDLPSSGPQGPCVPSQADVQRCEEIFRSGPSAIPCTASFPPGAHQCYAGCPPASSSSFGAWLGTGSAAPPAGNSPGGGAFLTFLALPCGGGLNQCIEFGAERIVVFQPLQQGGGHIWAVMEARSDSITLSTAATQNVRSGASIGATSQYQRGIATLGYASCGASGGSSDGKSIIPGFSIVLDTSLPASAKCYGPQPGYVWAAQSSSSLAEGNGRLVTDPIQGGSGVQLLGLTAVPVVMTFPDQEPQTAQPDGGSEGIPTPTPTVASTTGWESVTGDEEWTMDVPSDWQSKKIAANNVTGSGGSGDEFTGDGLTVDVFQGTEIVIPADDFSFPLDYGTLLTEQNDGVLVGTFRGDGWSLNVRITPDGSQVTPEQEAILRHMVASIAFPHIHPGDALAYHVAFADPVAQDQWMESGGRFFVLKSTTDGYIALGPVTCREDRQVHTHWTPSQTCPDSTDLAQWSANGTPAAGNAPGFQDPLSVHPVIRAWDGTLLAELEFGGVAGQDTGVLPSPSPTP
jgi:hypothetical protein